MSDNKKRKLEEYFGHDDDSIQTEISNAWDAINESQDAEEVDDDAKTVASEEPAKKVSADDQANEVEEEEEDYEDDNDDDNLIQPLKKRKTETGQIKETVETVFNGPSAAATGQIKDSQQAVYKKLNEQKLSKFMENTIGECKSVTNHDNSSESSAECNDSQTIYSEHFDEDTVFTFPNDHESIQSKDEYITLKERKDGKIERIVNQVNNDNIGKLKTDFGYIIEKYKEDRETTEIELSDLEDHYSNVFGNVGLLFYKYKKDKSNLHNAFFPTLLGKEVNLDDDTFNRIYKKQMVLDLCLFVYNLNLFEKINRPYTYITYNFVANDDGTKDASTAFSIASSGASSTSNRNTIKEIKGCKKICKNEIKRDIIGNDVICDDAEYDCSQLTDDGSDDELGGGKKSKSNQVGKKGSIKGPNKGPNKGPKKNHKTNKKRSNRSFMVKGKKTKPRKTQRKKNSKKKTQRKKLIVKKDLKKKTKRVRFAL